MYTSENVYKNKLNNLTLYHRCLLIMPRLGVLNLNFSHDV